jgi:transcriptional regulator with XRE-family HTH domain
MLHSTSPQSEGGQAAPRPPISRQRADFLRNCRARMQPSELGLPSPQRKRTQGLRREDVAALSGVSVAWYTWLEQGREMRVSEEVLERICHTFRLSEEEREYLFSLVQQRPPRLLPDAQDQVPCEILRMVEGLRVPGIVMNLRWDVLGWNQLNTLLFRDYAQIPLERRNLAEILLTGHALNKDPVELEEMARRMLAKLRVHYSQAGNDPKFDALLQRLDAASPLFQRLWHSPDIHVGAYGVYRFVHAMFGMLAFDHTSYVPDGQPGLRVTICMPHDAATRQVIETLNAQHFAQQA